MPSRLAYAFAGTWLAYAGLYLCRKNFSVLMPALSRDLHFSKDDLAQLVFAYSLPYAIGQFVSGTVADRAGPRVTVAAGMLVSAVASAAMAGARGLWIFAALQAVSGFAHRMAGRG